MRGGRRTCTFDGDSRVYLIRTEPGGEHTTAFCQKTEVINGVSHMCSFSMRTDRLKANLKKGNLHTCKFKPIEDIRAMFQTTRVPKGKNGGDLIRALASESSGSRRPLRPLDFVFVISWKWQILWPTASSPLLNHWSYATYVDFNVKHGVKKHWVGVRNSASACICMAEIHCFRDLAS